MELPPDEKKKRFRTPKAVPLDVVETACRYNANSEQVLRALQAVGCHISEDTLHRAIRRAYGLSFAEFRDSRADEVKLRLVQKAVAMAEDGNATMLIFCLKNLVGWRSEPPNEQDQYKGMSTRELIVLVKEKLPELEGKKIDDKEEGKEGSA